MRQADSTGRPSELIWTGSVLTMQKTVSNESEIAKLMEAGVSPAYPNLGEVVKGSVIAVGRNEVRVDIGGLAIGLIRGPELDKHLDLRLGDEVEATVIELDNEFGELELSLKGAGRKRSWEKIKELITANGVIQV